MLFDTVQLIVKCNLTKIDNVTSVLTPPNVSMEMLVKIGDIFIFVKLLVCVRATVL